MLIITPSCRPERIDWILDNWRRQRKEPGDRLLIVWNGCDPPVEPPIERGVMTTFDGETGNIGKAMDAGIAFALRAGHRTWTCFDDDDWYGSQALSLARAALLNADVVGRDSKFYRTTLGELWLLRNPFHNWPSSSFGLATIAARVHETRFERFNDGGPSWGVETRWLDRLAGKVRKGILPVQEFVHCRWLDVEHTTRGVSDSCVAFAFETAQSFGVQPFETATLPDSELPASHPIVFDMAQQMEDMKRAALAMGAAR